MRNRLCVFAVIIWIIGGEVTAAPNQLRSPVEVGSQLGQTRGDVILALMPEILPQQALIARLSSPWARFELTLNGQSLGRFRPGTILAVTPRLGQNRLQVRSVSESSQQLEVQFGAMRAAGVATALVVLEQGVASPVIARTLSRSVTQRIETALSTRTDGGIARVFELIRSGGIEARPLPTPRNWRAAGGGDSQSSGGGDGGDSTESQSDTTVSASTDTSTAASESPADTASESSAADSTASSSDSESTTSSDFDVSADRRSYY